MSAPAGYRVLARPLPRLAPPAPWWRLAAWWARRGPSRLEHARVRRALRDDPFSRRAQFAGTLIELMGPSEALRLVLSDRH